MQAEVAFLEEAAEVLIAGKNRNPEELGRESADLLYRLLVLWQEVGLAPSDVAAELERRAVGNPPVEQRK